MPNQVHGRQLAVNLECVKWVWIGIGEGNCRGEVSKLGRRYHLEGTPTN